MKTKVAFLTFLAAATVSCAWAQSTEDDDMYFTSKDRVAFSVAQNASRQAVLASTDSRRITESEVASTINPTDSYSARNVNPEYISGSKVGSNSTASVHYFSPNYQPTSVNQNLASNCNSCGYNNNFNSYNGFNNGYGYNRFGSFGSPYGMGGMSPYGYNSYSMMDPYSNYGGYGYSPYSMMGSGFYGSALSFGFGSGFGNSFGYGSPFGFGNNYGMNSYYGNSFFNPYGYGYGSSVVVVDNRNTTYGTRSSRSTSSPNYYNNNNGQGVNNGRSVAANGASTYYDRGWRQGANSTTRSTWDNPSNSGGNNRGWNNSNNGSPNSGGRQSNWDNSNNSFYNGGFSGGRSGGFSGGSSGSGGSGGRSGGGGRGGRN